MTISSISITLSTVLLASESSLADSMDHTRIGDPAVEAVEKKLAAAYPGAAVEVSWSRGAMMRHSIEVEVDGEPCGAGDREIADVRDTMHEALYNHLAG